MSFELFARICVGAPLRPDAAIALHAAFIQSLQLAPDCDPETLFEALRFEAPKHKKHEPDRLRYLRALEAFVDQEHNIDMALGGVSELGVFDPKKNYIFVGVVVSEFQCPQADLGRGAALPDKPQWLKWGDLGSTSDLGKTFPLDREVEKGLDHARRSYQRAVKDINKDAHLRVRPMTLSKQHDPDWAMCRWLVSQDHPSVQPRGRT
ncbi:MAG: hypothetical protein Q8Q09_20280 [Deltaproteobacteria bacterium]|nr:hypothetical protein [Deltaproteobacteria bacterium]